MDSFIKLPGNIKRRYVFLPFILLSFCLLFISLYKEVRNNTIEEFNRQQMLLAQQAAKSIERIFLDYFQDLSFLSALPDISAFSPEGEKIIQAYFAESREIITAVTRASEEGRIVYTIPANPDVIGADISYQTHIKTLLDTRQPVISDIFRAVQGYETIAYHIPVYNDSVFTGSLALLLSFDRITQGYFENIKIGEEGYALVYSQNGTILFAPEPEPPADSGEVTELDEMLKSNPNLLSGEPGFMEYQSRDRTTPKSKRKTKQCAFAPISFGGSHWIVCVTTPEKEILKTMAGFQIRLYLFSGLALFAFGIYTFYLLKFWAVYKETMLRREAEKALDASEERFKMLMEQAPFAIEIRTPDGELQHVNESWYRLFEAGNQTNKTVHGNIFKDQYAKKAGFDNAFRQALTGKKIDLADVVLYSESNPDFPVKRHFHSSFYPLLDAQDEIIYIAMTHEDITSRRNNETELEEYRSHLEELVDQRTREVKDKQVQLTHAGRLASLGEMASGVAHELNQPLSIIRFQTELLQLMEWKSDGSKKEVHEGLTTIVTEVDRASKIIDHMRYFARRDNKDQNPINIAEPILRSMDFFKEQFRVHDILLEVNIQPNLPSVLMDPQQMEQIVVNFINNARYAIDVLERSGTAKHRKLVQINAHTSKDKQYVVFEVTDSGIGMNKDVKQKCLDPFFTTKEVGQGTGLGLSIVHGIVQTFDGTLHIDTEPDSGSVFQVRFPVAE